MDVFSTLSAYGSAEPENYLTESLAFLLRLLLERSPQAGEMTIRRLAGLPVDDELPELAHAAVSTQVVVGEGRIDLHISAGADALIYVEIKHDAPLAPGQLEYYRARLDNTGLPNRRLVLLSRSRATAQQTTLPADRYHHVCWYEVHAWLAEAELSDPVCRYFADSFVRFLEEKHMSIEKVSWEYMRGVPALLKLTAMMEAAVHELWPQCGLRKTAGWSWRGFLIGGQYFFGVRLYRPLLVVLEDNEGTNPTFKRGLDLEGSHFFALDNGGQMESLIDFLRQSGIQPGEHDGGDASDEPGPA